MNSQLGRLKSTNTGRLSIKDKDRSIDSPAEVAEKFGRHFSTAASVALTTKYAQLSNECTALSAGYINSLFITHVEGSEIMTAIKKAENKSSSGTDGITIRLLKFLSDTLVKPITHLMNSILEQGIFPDALKVGLVIPIFKKGEKADANNYRPITLLNVLSKIFERIIYDKIVKFLKHYDILTLVNMAFVRVGRWRVLWYASLMMFTLGWIAVSVSRPSSSTCPKP